MAGGTNKRVTPPGVPSPGQGLNLAQISIEDLQALIQDAVRSAIAIAFAPLQAKLQEMTEKMEEIQKQLKESTQEISALTKTTSKVETKSEEMKFKVKAVRSKQNSMQEALVKLELNKAAYILRFQNIPEKKDENLKSDMAQTLAKYMDAEDTEEVFNEIDAAYRVNSAYAKRNKLPREVHVRFHKRTTRDDILKAANETSLQIEDKEINILKEIPWRVRVKRKDYTQLTSILRNNGIPYRWLLPEGLLFTYKGERYRINSTFKVEDFIKSHGEDLKTEEEQPETTEEDKQDSQGASGASKKPTSTRKTVKISASHRLKLKNKEDTKSQSQDG